MKIAIKTIANLVNGRIEGNKKLYLSHPSNIDRATSGSITFLSNPKYESHIYTTKASAILVDKTFVPKRPLSTPLIRVTNAYSSFAQVLKLFEQTFPPSKGVGINTSIHPSAKIGKNCHIGDLVYICLLYTSPSPRDS